MKTKRKRREESRQRMQQTRRRRTAAGMKAVTIVLAPERYALLNRLKEKQGGTYAQVIGKALDAYAEALPAQSAAAPFSVQPDPAPPAVYRPGDRLRVNNPLSRYHGRLLTVDSHAERFGVVRGTIDGAVVRFNADYVERPGRS